MVSARRPRPIGELLRRSGALRLSRTVFWVTPWLAAGVGLTQSASAQISLSTAVNLALQNSPKVKVAQAEIARANAVLAESKETFVPAISVNGGVGKSTGAPLGPPVVFSISAQSLVFNFSQRDYIRASHSGLDSAELALDVARSEVVEDATYTYVTLDNALERRGVQREALSFAHRLVTVADERFRAGVDPHLELTKARHTEAQIHLQELLVDDEISEQAGHLARLSGLTAQALTTEHDSIPKMQPPSPVNPEDAPDPRRMVGLSAAYAAAQAKRYTALGERKYVLRPQIAFSANYSRISTAFTTYTQYYPRFAAAGNSLNSLNLGVEITVPILDMVHRARAREADADAVRSLADAQAQQMLFFDGRDKLRRSAAELAAREELAGIDRDLAEDQLQSVLVRLQADAGAIGGDQLSPKDEQSARLAERLRRLDMLSADLQLKQAEISLMRQEGSLTSWLAATIPSATATADAAAPTPITPATVGMPPSGGTTLPGSTVPIAPTTGVPPGNLPAGPVTHPALGGPLNPPATPLSGPPQP